MTTTQTTTQHVTEAAATIIFPEQAVTIVRRSRRGLYLVRRADGKTEWVSSHNVRVG